MSSKSFIVILLLVALAGGVYYYFTYGGGKTVSSPVATSTPTGSSSGSGATSTPVVKPTPEALCEAAGGTFESSVNECVLPLILVASPLANALVTSTINVSGKARGYWYFEASFPLEVTDSKGKVLATSHAEAQSEWMTEEYVPFKGKITFTVPKGGDGKGFVVFKKDNPSGLPENDASVKVPIRFY